MSDFDKEMTRDLAIAEDGYHLNILNISQPFRCEVAVLGNEEADGDCRSRLAARGLLQAL